MQKQTDPCPEVPGPPEDARRRRLPRRQIVTGIAIELRRGDRRRKIPCSNGTYRAVLADDWQSLFATGSRPAYSTDR